MLARLFALLGVALSLLAHSPARALAPSALPAGVTAGPAVEGVRAYALRNGLRFLLVPDATSSTVTVHITYRVGSVHEGAGEAGMAHLLEHMLFKGTARHPRFDEEMDRRGGDANAETETEFTRYYETFAASPEHLRFGLDLEADRMTNVRLRRADLDKELTVARNELEIGENDPRGVLPERILRGAYLWHGYGRAVIGTTSDLEKVPLDRLQTFYRRHYRPDNALLIVAGAFDERQALRDITSLFGPIARPAAPLVKSYTVEPVQDGERQVKLRRVGELQLVGLHYHGVPGAHPDFPALLALEHILTRPGSGRLHQALVKTGLATRVEGLLTPTADRSGLLLYIEARRDKRGGAGAPAATPAAAPAAGAVDRSLEVLRDQAVAVVEGLGAEPPPGTSQPPLGADELRRFQVAARAQFNQLVRDTRQLVDQLSQWDAAGDWRLLFLLRDRIEQLSVAQVQAVARRYLLPSNRTVGLFVPTEKPVRAPPPAPVKVPQLVAGYKGRGEVAPGEPFAPTFAALGARLSSVRLPSGLTLWLLPKKTRGATVQLGLLMQLGSLETLRGREAQLELLGPMLLRGTRQHTRQQILDRLDELHASLEIESTGPQKLDQDVLVSGSTTREHLPALLDLLTELVRDSSFPSAEVEEARKERLADREHELRDPQAQAAVALTRLVMPYPQGDPRYVPTIEEQIARLKAVRQPELVALHRELCGGDSGHLALVGDFDAAQVTAQLSARLGDFRAQKPFVRLPRPFHATRATLHRIHTPDKQAAVSALLLPMPISQRDPDWPLLSMWHEVLGGGNTSRLWQRVREREGLSYSVESAVSASAFEPAGFLAVFSTVAPQNAMRALDAMVEEIAALLEKPPTEAELERVKQGLVQDSRAQLGDDTRVVSLLLTLAAEGRSLADEEAQLKRALAVPPAEAVAAARRYIDRARMIRLLAGDLAKAAEPDKDRSSAAAPEAARQPATEAAPRGTH
ncbi:MAG: insulinase family protein [Polyangia bacterium]